MLTYRGLLDDATTQLFESSDTPRIDAELLLLHVIEQPLAWLIAYGETQASGEHVKTFYKFIKQRHAGQPVAYLVGKRDFWTLSLKVNSDVLIPRPDTETLVEQALEVLPRDTELDVLDLGTGSGAIALAIAKERPMAKVLAVDSQNAALKVAQENAQLNQIHNVTFIQSNWFSDIADVTGFDLIASNPPYVEAGDPHLDQGDLRFEPQSALVAGGKGLDDIQHIVHTSAKYLQNDGWLFIEHGSTQSSEVAALFEAEGFNSIKLQQDISGLPRCTYGQR